MSNSLSFNGFDLGVYGLIVTGHDISTEHRALSTQLLDKSHAGYSFRTPKSISLDVVVVGTSLTNLKSQLDNIRNILNEKASANLILDIQNDRYWLARFESFNGKYHSPLMFSGNLIFTCYDPLAYSVSELSHGHTLDVEDPKTIEETTGGTALIEPVYTFTAGDDITPATLKVKNLNLDEELTWVGNITTAQTLVVDVPRWIVELVGSASMSGVSGQFPRLLPGQVNNVKITGFGLLGTLNIKYRNKFM